MDDLKQMSEKETKVRIVTHKLKWSCKIHERTILTVELNIIQEVWFQELSRVKWHSCVCM